MDFLQDNRLKELKKNIHLGTKIRMESMSDPYAPIPPGIEGIVDFVDDIGTLHCTSKMGAVLVLLLARTAFQLLNRKKNKAWV